MGAPPSLQTLWNLFVYCQRTKLFIKTTRPDGKTKEANFNLGNVSDIRNKITHACDWDDTPNDPVGSVDHSVSPH
jgi:hypothetical protein